jgi:hypothetical protein
MTENSASRFVTEKVAEEGGGGGSVGGGSPNNVNRAATVQQSTPDGELSPRGMFNITCY